jgi:hypothetical protein
MGKDQASPYPEGHVIVLEPPCASDGVISCGTLVFHFSLWYFKPVITIFQE